MNDYGNGRKDVEDGAFTPASRRYKAGCYVVNRVRILRECYTRLNQ